MSVISSRKSSNTSILKKTSTLKNKLKTVAATPSKVRFVLPHSQNVRNILLDYVKNNNRKDYEALVCLIRDSELFPNDIFSLLKEASESISLLNHDLRLFVEAILSIKWNNCEEDLVSEYQSFLVNLLSAHNYHAKHVIDHLVALFIPCSQEEMWLNGVPRDADCVRCVNVHSALNILLKIVPMCRDILIQSLRNQYPYFSKGTHINEYYLHNLLWVLDYQPSFRSDILHLIISKLIIMDVNAPREELEIIYSGANTEDMFPIDDVVSSGRIVPLDNASSIAQSLDVCLNRFFDYILSECHDPLSGELVWERTKNLYHDLLNVFDEAILPTYNCHHVQYYMFVLCGFKSTLAEGFLNYLWKKVCDPNVPAVLRQASAGYIASFLARATYVPLHMLKGTLQQMAEWIHSYIASQDGLECVNSDVRIHWVFYSICQCLFYSVTFIHKELITAKKNMVFLESLNLAKIVTCRLNPLRVCQPAVVQNFAAFTRKYQLAYCYTIIENNSRNTMPTIYQDERGGVLLTNNVLDVFYPFDPYILKMSREKVLPFYRHYRTFPEDHNSEMKETTEVDDFLEHIQDFSTTSKSSSKFSYGSSPGFKFNG